MKSLRNRILERIGACLEMDLVAIDLNRRVYDVFLESLRDGPESGNLPSATDGLRPTDYITLEVSMALEDELQLQLDGDWWSGLLQFGSFLDLEHRLFQELEDRVRLSVGSTVGS